MHGHEAGQVDDPLAAHPGFRRFHLLGAGRALQPAPAMADHHGVKDHVAGLERLLGLEQERAGLVGAPQGQGLQGLQAQRQRLPVADPFGLETPDGSPDGMEQFLAFPAPGAPFMNRARAVLARSSRQVIRTLCISSTRDRRSCCQWPASSAMARSGRPS